MNAPGQIHALKHMFIPQKAHTDIYFPSHKQARHHHHQHHSTHRRVRCICQSFSQLYQVSVIFLADQPSRHAVRVNTGPPAALQCELLTPTIMHLAFLQPSFSLPAFTFLPLFTTPAFMDSNRSITQSTPCTLSSPPPLLPPNPCLGSYPTIPGI